MFVLGLMSVSAADGTSYLRAGATWQSGHWWMLTDPEKGADLCSEDPGFDVDLYVRCDLKTMTAIWMGIDTVARAVDEDRLLLVGDADVIAGMQDWLGLSPFAPIEKRAS